MNELEDLLRDTLRERADAVDDLEPRTRARAAVAAGRADRRRSRAIAAGAVAVAVAASGGYLARGFARDAVPAPNPLGTVTATPSTSTTPSSASTPPRWTVGPAPRSAFNQDYGLPAPRLDADTAIPAAVAKLPTGAPAGHLPRVDVVGGQRFVVTKLGRFPLPAGQVGVAEVAQLDDGLLLRTISDEFTGGGVDPSAVLLKQATDGRVTTWAKRNGVAHLAASPGGTQVALLIAGTTPGDRVVIEVREASSGRLANTVEVPVDRLGRFGEARLLGWTTTGLIVSGPPYGSPVVALAPATGAVAPLGSPVSVVVGGGDVVVVQNERGQQCAYLGLATASRERITCAPEMLATRALDGSVALMTTAGPAAAEKAHDARYWLVQTYGVVTSGIKPGWLGGYVGQESPTVWLMDCQSTAGKPCLVRWDLAKGTLQRAS